MAKRATQEGNRRGSREANGDGRVVATARRTALEIRAQSASEGGSEAVCGLPTEPTASGTHGGGNRRPIDFEPLGAHDASIAGNLNAFAFTHPTTVADLGVLRDRIKSWAWSIPPLVDATLKADEVSLEVRVGNSRLIRTWRIQ